MLTVMGIKADGLEIDMAGTTAEVTKTMASKPRRISKIKVQLNFPFKTNSKSKKILEHAAKTCPVFYSLHPEIIKGISFNWK